MAQREKGQGAFKKEKPPVIWSTTETGQKKEVAKAGRERVKINLFRAKFRGKTTEGGTRNWESDIPPTANGERDTILQVLAF